MDAMAEKLTDVDTQAAGFIDRFSTGLSSKLTQALTTGKFAFKEFALSIITDLTSMIIKALVFNSIHSALRGTALGNLLNGAAGGNVTKAKSKASGGGLNRGKPFMVGEQGRELFVPKTDGHLVPNHKLDDGAPLTVNFNINAIDTQTGVGFLVNNKQSIIGMIDQAYRKQGRQGVMA
jgi:phage-related minor tail protein